MLGRPESTTGGVTRGFIHVPRMTRDNGIFASDEEIHIFADFFKTLAREKGISLPPMVLEQPEMAANEYIRNYGLVAVILEPEGRHVCYSLRYRNKLPVPFIDRIRNQLQLMPDETVLWSDDVFKAPQPGPAREIVYGQRLEKPPKKKHPPAFAKTREPQPGSRADVRKKWVHPQELTQAELDYLMGKTSEPPPGI